MGWRTVEVTPGFYEEVYHADIVVAVPSEEIDNGAGDGSGLVISEEFELSETGPFQEKGSAGSAPAFAPSGSSALVVLWKNGPGTVYQVPVRKDDRKREDVFSLLPYHGYDRKAVSGL
jgi:hypothetical protein